MSCLAFWLCMAGVLGVITAIIGMLLYFFITIIFFFFHHCYYYYYYCCYYYYYCYCFIAIDFSVICYMLLLLLSFSFLFIFFFSLSLSLNSYESYVLKCVTGKINSGKKWWVKESYYKVLTLCILIVICLSFQVSNDWLPGCSPSLR